MYRVVGQASCLPVCRGFQPRVSVPTGKLEMRLDPPAHFRWCSMASLFKKPGGRMPTEPAGWKPALVRLRRRWVGAVEVRSHAVKNRVVSNRNCVAATRGGEQWNENDQSVTNVLPGRRTP